MSVKFNEFCMDKDNWENYVDRFEFCLVANGIQTDELKKANFFAVCGHSLYDLIVSLISPKKIKDITYANVKLLLDDYFNPKQNEIVQSYKFHIRRQLDSENIKEYVASLRKLAIDCNFADLDRTLRDRLVCGIRDKYIQKQLLQQTSLTFDQAIRLSLTAEGADAGVMVTVPVSSASAPAPLLNDSSDEPMEVVEYLKEEEEEVSLYAGHEVQDELVLGPEGLQPRDVASILYAAQALAVQKQHKLRDCVVRLERIDDPALGSQQHIHPGTEQEDNGNSAARGGHRDHTYAKTECPPEGLARVGPSRGLRGGRGKTRGRGSTGGGRGETRGRGSARGGRGKTRGRGSTGGGRGKTPGRGGRGETRGRGSARGGRGKTRGRGSTCQICNYTFKSASNLKVHERTHTGERPYSCGTCNKKFTESGHLKNHERIHTGEKPYFCRTCNKKFAHIGNLKAHERSHTGERPFSCGICKRKFMTSSHLKAHQRIHTGERPFSCGICKRTFTTLFILKTHERIHTGEKPYSCRTCNEKFAQSKHLKSHERIHTGETPYSCGTCNKNFKRLNSLKYHERTHTRERPYSCGICENKFTSLFHLECHERIHTGEKPFSCRTCNKKFTQLSNLKTHERTVSCGISKQ